MTTTCNYRKADLARLATSLWYVGGQSPDARAAFQALLAQLPDGTGVERFSRDDLYNRARSLYAARYEAVGAVAAKPFGLALCELCVALGCEAAAFGG